MQPRRASTTKYLPGRDAYPRKDVLLRRWAFLFSGHSMLTTALAGAVMAISFSAPPGPVAMETVRRGLGGGFRPALSVQLGSIIGDFTWCGLALVGLAPAGADWLGTQRLSVAGVAVLLYLGAARAARRGRAAHRPHTAGGARRRARRRLSQRPGHFHGKPDGDWLLAVGRRRAGCCRRGRHHAAPDRHLRQGFSGRHARLGFTMAAGRPLGQPVADAGNLPRCDGYLQRRFTSFWHGAGRPLVGTWLQ